MFHCRYCEKVYKTKQGRWIHEKEKHGNVVKTEDNSSNSNDSLEQELYDCLEKVDEMKLQGESDLFIQQKVGVLLKLDLQKARQVTDGVAKIVKFKSEPNFFKELEEIRVLQNCVTDSALLNGLSYVTGSNHTDTVYLRKALADLKQMIAQKEEELKQLTACLRITNFSLHSAIPNSNSLELVLLVAHEVEKNHRSGIIGDVKKFRSSDIKGSM
jgi:hypothetical protein